MGRGRKPLPTQIKRNKGTLRKHRVLTTEFAAETLSTLPAAPEILNDLGRSEWYRFCAELEKNGLLATLDLSLLTAYCTEMENYFEMEELLRLEGRVVPTDKGVLTTHPAVLIARNSLKAAREIAVLFGATPSARTKLPGKSQAPVSPLQALLATYSQAQTEE